MRPVLGRRLAPLVQALSDFALMPLSAGFVEAPGGSEVILRDMMPRKVVGVAVALTVAEDLRSGVMTVPQVVRHGEGSSRSNILQGRIDGFDHRVAFVGGGDVEGRLGDGDAGLGPSDDFGGLAGGGGQYQGRSASTERGFKPSGFAGFGTPAGPPNSKRFGCDTDR